MRVEGNLDAVCARLKTTSSSCRSPVPDRGVNRMYVSTRNPFLFVLRSEFSSTSVRFKHLSSYRDKGLYRIR